MEQLDLECYCYRASDFKAADAKLNLVVINGHNNRERAASQTGHGPGRGQGPVNRRRCDPINCYEPMFEELGGNTHNG